MFLEEVSQALSLSFLDPKILGILRLIICEQCFLSATRFLLFIFLLRFWLMRFRLMHFILVHSPMAVFIIVAIDLLIDISDVDVVDRGNVLMQMQFVGHLLS